MIEFESVTKVYPGGTVAVDELSLAVPAGRITVVVGPAGAGKSTLLRMVNRLVDPSSGRVLVDGVANTGVRRSQLRRGIGYVLANAGLFPHRTVADNIATVPLLTGVRRRDARAMAHALLARVGLPETFADTYPGQLAGGQQMRVALARALAADPPILLMDEPFSHLDPVIRGDLQDDLLDLQAAAPKTILFATHDIDEAIKLADQIAVLDRGGRLAQLATPETLLVNPGSEFIADFLGRDRGIRKLAFLPAGDLPLAAAGTVQAGATGARAKAIADQHGGSWLLVLDPERHPRGWVDTSLLLPEEVVTGTVVHPLGGTFYPDESVLAAMDAAILSPPGLAVCISDEGNALGVVSHAEIARYLGSRQPAAGGPAASRTVAAADASAHAAGADAAVERPAAGSAEPVGEQTGERTEQRSRVRAALEARAAALATTRIRTAPERHTEQIERRDEQRAEATSGAGPLGTVPLGKPAAGAGPRPNPVVKAASRPTAPMPAAAQDPVVARPAGARRDAPELRAPVDPAAGKDSGLRTAETGTGDEAGSATDAEDSDLDTGRWEWRGDLGQWVRVTDEDPGAGSPDGNGEGPRS